MRPGTHLFAEFSADERYTIGMRYILLTQGQKVLVDDEDFEMLSQYKWHLHSTGYARKSSPKMYMHRLIMNPDKKLQVDHKNHNRLDNRRQNLRVCTEEQNKFNMSDRKDNTSGFRGVTWNKEKHKWTAQIGFKGTTKNLGHHLDKIEAAKAYNTVAQQLFGDFARLNEV